MKPTSIHLWLGVLLLSSNVQAQPNQVFPTISVQPDRILLSGSTQLALALEGPSPMRIDLPNEPESLLTHDSATVWQIRPLGSPKITPLEAGRERWEQSFRLNPFLPGDKLTIAFAPLKVFVGGQLNSQEIVFPSKEVRVQTTIADARADSARPVTGIEEVPKVEPPPPESIGWQFAAMLAGIFAVVLLLVVVRKSQAKPPPLPPTEWAQRELDRLELDIAMKRITPLQAADRLALIVREFIEMRFGLQATKLTTAELIMEIAASWSTDQVELLREVLERCDRAKFAADSPEDQEAQHLMKGARRIVAASRPVLR